MYDTDAKNVFFIFWLVHIKFVTGFFICDTSDLYLDSSVPVLDAPPSPLTFLRDYVSRNKPVIIKNAFNHWLALKHWNNDYLR